MTAKLFLVVEDHPDVAERNCLFLNKVEPLAHCVVAGNPEQAKERLKLETPELIVVDLMFKDIGGEHSGESGLDLLRHIFSEYSPLNILIYTTDPNLLQPIVKEAQAHQGGFIVADKSKRRSDFINKVRMLLDNPGLKLIPPYLTTESDSIELTDNERKLLQLVCQDCLTDSLIAEELKVSRKTVQNSMQSLRTKLEIFTTRSENDLRLLMCHKAREKGLI